MQNEQTIEPARVNASVDALKAEFPDKGIAVIITDAMGRFSFASNITPMVSADLLMHVARHMRGECKC